MEATVKSTAPISLVLDSTTIQRFKDQMLIVLLKRLVDKDGVLRLSVSEIDDTGQDLLTMEAQGTDLVFKLSKKH